MCIVICTVHYYIIFIFIKIEIDFRSLHAEASDMLLRKLPKALLAANETSGTGPNRDTGIACI